ncbi:MAG: sodium:solute symporter [Bacteroidetes bacterium]|nr:sodium:solute symporter [Bacteroidota bacterium]
MSPFLILGVLIGYFSLLFVISYFTGKNSTHADFFIGGKSSKWYVVAFGMIGASLSGVTFISIPGKVGADGFSYMQMVLGYLLGYVVIAQVLLPLYYRLNLTSIYGYLERRYGVLAHKTGAAFFLISRVIGASCRLFLVAMVLDAFVCQPLGIPFWLTSSLTILLIWVYSLKGGIKTIVWTDTLQTAFMLLALVIAVFSISSELNLSLGEMVTQIKDSSYSKTFFGDWGSSEHFLKMFLSGMFITITMTGLDQDMMQKNLSVKTLKDSQKNMYWMSLSLVPVNLLFLALGALLFIYGIETGVISTHYKEVANGTMDSPILALQNGQMLSLTPDKLFPYLAINHLGAFVGIVFIIGLVAAAYSSADSALTSLTTSFCIDFLGFQKKEYPARTRYLVHVGFSVVLIVAILVIKELSGQNKSLIDQLFTLAGYTYGPLLGLFAFGLMSKRITKDIAIPFMAIACIILTYFSTGWLKSEFDFNIGHARLLLNGGLMFLGLWLFSLANRPTKAHS